MDSKNFLEKLQSADEATKTRWLVVSSTLLSILVVFVWLKYFNTLFEPSQIASVQQESEEHFSFRKTVSGGAALMYESLKETIRSIGGIFHKERSYLITPSE